VEELTNIIERIITVKLSAPDSLNKQYPVEITTTEREYSKGKTTKYDSNSKAEQTKNINSETAAQTKIKAKEETDKIDKTTSKKTTPGWVFIGVPWMLAFALRTAGWYLRQDIIWHKPNPMPESIRDRCTKAHEYLFLLTKSARYYFDHSTMLEPAKYDGRKKMTHDGSAKYLNNTAGIGTQNVFKGGHERWPNKIRGYAEKEGQVGLSEQYHGTNIKPRPFGSKNQTGTGRNDIGNVWIDTPARNKRSVWTVPTRAFKGAHLTSTL